ncbi:hypothetical protein CDD83_10523 [Cordyceps sp. RAO-2017]|nr:hypothetical protein CDD83_10523 [Cordyceps sp. RAO-2017]
MASLLRGLLFPRQQGLMRARLQPVFCLGQWPLTGGVRRSVVSSASGRKAAEAAQSVAARELRAPSNYALIKQLASKPTPTILYEAPSHFWFYFGCWSTGLGLVTWTALTGPMVMQQPEGVPRWVRSVYMITYVLLAGMGFYLIRQTANVVGSIRLLPSAGAGGQPARSVAPASPRMEVTVKRMLPLLSPKVMTTSLDKVTLETRFSLPEAYVPALKRHRLEREEAARRKQQHEFDMNHLLMMPFRHLGRGLVRMFYGIRASWTDLSYGTIKVDGKNLKVDVTGGFAHDGFRTLERVVRVGS